MEIEKIADPLPVPPPDEAVSKENGVHGRHPIPGPSLPHEEILPGGWMKKVIGGSSVYISPSGSIVHSIQQVFQSTKKEETSNQNKKEKIESPAAGSKPSKR